MAVGRSSLWGVAVAIGVRVVGGVGAAGVRELDTMIQSQGNWLCRIIVSVKG